ncbi:CinA family protein [Campylobacter sp. MIT 12-5580]|uniref:CinA family protein n=1 Tax=Campylobacter sp. MIT 12-5580 TaxID=2040651 RepID=UPI0010F8CFCB|nr:CinA family protein [Campylobacter sp. MIT 12-5580]TKX28760.1 CinA family protein [Campylobacter sp. MIT 12-5580]
MRHLLLIIGEDLHLHKNFIAYICEEYEKKFKELNELKILTKASKDLPFLLENWIKEFNYITIFSNQTNYVILAKILATLNEDLLVLKNDILVPSKTLTFDQHGFISTFERSKVNCIKTELQQKLPAILHELEDEFDFFMLKDIDEESARLLLETLTKSYDTSIQTTSILENLILIKASNIEHAKLESFFIACKNLFGAKMMFGNNPLEYIAQTLKEKNLKISFAESCTAGLCAANLAKIDGVSALFEGSLITYSNRLKHEWLGISQSVLEDGGEYSERCVYFMLKGTFKTSGCDFALAISGVAGEADEPTCKSGRVFIGAMYKDGTFLQEMLDFKGNRNFIREQACLAAFCLMMRLKPEIFV